MAGAGGAPAVSAGGVAGAPANSVGGEGGSAGESGAAGVSGAGGEGGSAAEPFCPRWSGEAADPNGVLQGDAELGVPGQIDGALNLPNSGHLQVPDTDVLDAGTSDWSIAFWVQTTVDGGTLAHKRMVSPELRGYVLFIDVGRVGVQLADNVLPPNYTNYISDADINDGLWHHVAVTLDRDQTDGLKVYLDGSLNSIFDPTDRPGDLSNSEPLNWGANYGGTSGMIGMLDEMSVHQRVLTPEEITLLTQGQTIDIAGCD